MRAINLFHIFIVGPLLLQLSQYIPALPSLTQRELSISLLTLTLTMAFFVPLPLSILPLSSWYNIISLSHFGIWLALFGYIGWVGLTRQLSETEKQLCALLGLMVIVVHIYLAIQPVKIV
jgi:hypothetical protein